MTQDDLSVFLGDRDNRVLFLLCVSGTQKRYEVRTRGVPSASHVPLYLRRSESHKPVAHISVISTDSLYDI